MTKTKEELNQLNVDDETLGNKIKESNEEELKQVVGGNEPEEFDWHDRGYTTPKKDDPADSDPSLWKFSAIGNTDGQYFKIINGGKEHSINPKDKDDWLK